VTPDSFSNAGLARDTPLTEDAWCSAAVSWHKHPCVDEWFHTFTDIGGESTRPTHPLISAEQELARVLPVIRALRATRPQEIVLLLIMYKAQVARQALLLVLTDGQRYSCLRHDGQIYSAVTRAKKVPLCVNGEHAWRSHAMRS